MAPWLRGATLFLAPVVAPGPNGVSIGNSVATFGHPLNGQIDDVKIWRLNPRRYDEAFNCRPLDFETVDCWVRFRREVTEALRRHPECTGKLGAVIDDARRSILHQAIARAQNAGTARQRNARIRELWCAGKVGGPEMAQVSPI